MSSLRGAISKAAFRFRSTCACSWMPASALEDRGRIAPGLRAACKYFAADTPRSQVGIAYALVNGRTTQGEIADRSASVAAVVRFLCCDTSRARPNAGIPEFDCQ